VAVEERAVRSLGIGMGSVGMGAREETRYRLRLAEGFLQEARQDITSGRWRSCVDNAQLTVENSAKAVLALFGPVGRTHTPGLLLRNALAEGRLAGIPQAQIERLAASAEILGPDVHVQSDYGDEGGWRTPWELFDEPDARQALTFAE
jgi:HEPN domain-containing protein